MAINSGPFVKGALPQECQSPSTLGRCSVTTQMANINPSPAAPQQDRMLGRCLPQHKATPKNATQNVERDQCGIRFDEDESEEVVHSKSDEEIPTR